MQNSKNIIRRRKSNLIATMKVLATTKHTVRYTHLSLVENTKAKAGAICAENIIIRNGKDSKEDSLRVA